MTPSIKRESKPIKEHKKLLTQLRRVNKPGRIGSKNSSLDANKRINIQRKSDLEILDDTSTKVKLSYSYRIYSQKLKSFKRICSVVFQRRNLILNQGHFWNLKGLF